MPTAHRLMKGKEVLFNYTTMPTRLVLSGNVIVFNPTPSWTYEDYWFEEYSYQHNPTPPPEKFQKIDRDPKLMKALKAVLGLTDDQIENLYRAAEAAD